MQSLDLSNKQIFIVIVCDILSHTQLSDADLDSTIGIDTAIRKDLITKLYLHLCTNISQGTEAKVKVELTTIEKDALQGIIAHGSFWFNDTFLNVSRDDCQSLLDYIK